MPPGKSAAMTDAGARGVSGPYNPIPEDEALAWAWRTSIDLLLAGHHLPGAVGGRVVAVDALQHAVDDAVDDALLGIGLVDAEEVLLGAGRSGGAALHDGRHGRVPRTRHERTAMKSRAYDGSFGGKGDGHHRQARGQPHHPRRRDRVLAMDLHTAQIQGFFDIPVNHLYAAPVIDEHFKAMELAGDDFVVVSPDEGSIKRALDHMSRLGGHLAIIDKRRSTAERTKQANVIGGKVEGRVALIFDDMISTAGSICGAAEVMHQHGARQIFLAATHGLLVGESVERLKKAPIDGLVLTDTIPLPPEKEMPKLTVLSIAPLLGEAVKRIHRNESVSGLFD